MSKLEVFYEKDEVKYSPKPLAAIDHSPKPTKPELVASQWKRMSIHRRGILLAAKMNRPNNGFVQALYKKYWRQPHKLSKRQLEVLENISKGG